MTHIIPFLLNHAYAAVFASVLAELLGLPISSIPLLLAAGALAGSHRLSLGWLVVLAVLACLIADSAWYQLGKLRGYSILRLLCRISIEPDSCVRRTHDRYARQGARALLIAKFIPGLGTAAAPLAGLLRMAPLRFLTWDVAGSLLWAGGYLGTGYLFSRELDRVGQYAMRLGAGLIVLLAAGLAAYVGWKYRERRRLMRQLRIARMTPEELFQRMSAGEKPVVVDLRGLVEFEADPAQIPGAIRLLPQEVEQRHQEIPRDRDVVLYCT
jgi:membrane protein DedA with SNARE-associated domain